MIVGRALDKRDPDTLEEGETNFIIVSRNDLFKQLLMRLKP